MIASVAGAVVALAAAWFGTSLIRLALTLHRRSPVFGPGQGAGLLGLAVIGLGLTGLGIAAAGAEPPAVDGARLADVIAGVGAVAIAVTSVLGLLLLPGAAPTMAVRVRRCLDGLGISACLSYAVWVCLPGPLVHQAVGGTLVVLFTAALAVAIAVATGLRAPQFNPAIQGHPATRLCAAGTALTVTGAAVMALAGQRGSTSGLLLATVAELIGPALVLAGAHRAGTGPARSTPDAPEDPLVGYPTLIVPFTAALGATGYRLLAIGSLDLTAQLLALAAVAAIGAREAIVTVDIREYARRLAARETRFRALISGSTDVTVVLDRDLVVRWQSSSAARQFALADQDVLGQPFSTLIHPVDAPTVDRSLAAVLAGRSDHGDPLLTARLRDGFGRWRDTESTISDQRGIPEVDALVLQVRDVTDRRDLEFSLDRMSTADQLTGLANRRRLRRAAGERHSIGLGGTVLSIELDGLAGINALHGETVGDAVLVEGARRIRTTVGAGDLAARLGGLEFAVLTASTAMAAYALANTLVTLLMEEYRLPGVTVRVSATVGVADLVADADSALRRADLARRRARQVRTGRVESFDESVEAAVVRRMNLDQHLPGAIGRGELTLEFQPVMELSGLHPVGLESLLRWRSPRLGTLLPTEVIPVAEHLGMLDEVGEWVVHGACRQLSRWLRDGRDLWVSVNVSVGQLRGDRFLPTLAAALDAHAVPADRLVVEVAADHLGGDEGPVRHRGPGSGQLVLPERLAALRSIGVRTAVDGFGTGAATLVHLRRLPIDVVKIDRSLFAEPASSRSPATPILEAVVEMSRRIGVEVVATGLEDATHVSVARAAGCRFGQGYHLARPTHPEHVEAFLERHREPLF